MVSHRWVMHVPNSTAMGGELGGCVALGDELRCLDCDGRATVRSSTLAALIEQATGPAAAERSAGDALVELHDAWRALSGPACTGRGGP